MLARLIEAFNVVVFTPHLSAYLMIAFTYSLNTSSWTSLNRISLGLALELVLPPGCEERLRTCFSWGRACCHSGLIGPTEQS